MECLRSFLTSFNLTIHIVQQLFRCFCLSVTDRDGDIVPREILDGRVVEEATMPHGNGNRQQTTELKSWRLPGKVRLPHVSKAAEIDGRFA